ncbi:RNA polymerase sigma factor [Parabacteroides faecis]|uniref:RNA polymerase sigma factor n=1 Tax=Parabacteroides faecis TaxID=1217282 RepID=UPI0035229837
MTEKYNSFTILYEQQYERLFRFALHFVPDHEDCEDILADVFVSIWENWDSLKKIDNLNSYLFTAIKNRCLKFLNKRNYFEEYIEDLHIHLSIDHTTPEALQDSNEITGIIEDALNQLPQRCKLIFLMLKEDNLKYKEVADILGISEKTVQAQQIIAKKKLTEIVGHYIKDR